MALVNEVANNEEMITRGRDLANENTLSTIVGIASIKSIEPTKMKTIMVKKITSFNSNNPPLLNSWLIFSGIDATHGAMETSKPLCNETITSEMLNRWMIKVRIQATIEEVSSVGRVAFFLRDPYKTIMGGIRSRILKLNIDEMVIRVDVT